MPKKTSKKAETALTPAQVIAVVSTGGVKISYSKGATITRDYNSVRHDVGIEVTVPEHDLERAKTAVYDYIDGELEYLSSKPIITKTDTPQAKDDLDTQLEVPLDTAPTAEDKSLAETLESELDSLAGPGVPEEEAIPDEF